MYIFFWEEYKYEEFIYLFSLARNLFLGPKTHK